MQKFINHEASKQKEKMKNMSNENQSSLTAASIFGGDSI